MRSFATTSGGCCKPSPAQSSAESSWIFDAYRSDHFSCTNNTQTLVASSRGGTNEVNILYERPTYRAACKVGASIGQKRSNLQAAHFAFTSETRCLIYMATEQYATYSTGHPYYNLYSKKANLKKGRVETWRKTRKSGVIIILKLVKNAPILRARNPAWASTPISC